MGNRFNDLHGSRFQWKSEFLSNHPEYELGDKSASPQERLQKQSSGMNFAIPQVRAHRLALLEEACTRYERPARATMWMDSSGTSLGTPARTFLTWSRAGRC